MYVKGINFWLLNQLHENLTKYRKFIIFVLQGYSHNRQPTDHIFPINPIFGSKWPQKSHICPIFSPRKIPHFPYFFQNAQWAACHKEINVTGNYKIYAEENLSPPPEFQYSICSRSPLKSGRGGGGGGGCWNHANFTLIPLIWYIYLWSRTIEYPQA